MYLVTLRGEVYQKYEVTLLACLIFFEIFLKRLHMFSCKWIKLSVDKQENGQEGANLSSASCKVSSTTWNRLKWSAFVFIQAKLNAKPRLFEVNVDDLLEDNVVRGDLSASSVLLRSVQPPKLAKIVLKVQSNDLEDVKRTLHGAKLPLACHEGRKLMERAGMRVFVDACEPTSVGLWTSETEVILQVQDLPKNKVKLLHFALNLANPPWAQLSSSLYPFQLREKPSESVTSTSTVFIPRRLARNGSDFVWLTGQTEKHLLAKCAEMEEEEAASTEICAEAAFLAFIKHKLKSQRFRLSFPAEHVQVQGAEEAKIAFISSPIYEELSTHEVDSVLEAAFEKPIYLFEGQIVELKLDECPNLPLELCNGSVHFQVLSLAPSTSESGENDVGMSVSKGETKLFQKTKLHRELPSKSIISSLRHGIPIEILPKFLQKQVEKMAKLVKYGPILVTGNDKEAILEALALKLGLNKVRADCSSWIGDSSGSTEGKLKHFFIQIKGQTASSLAILDNVSLLAFNREGQLDFRVLERLKLELEADLCLIACDESEENVPQVLASIFSTHLTFGQKPNFDERLDILKWTSRLNDISWSQEVDLRELARNAVNFSFEDLQFLCNSTLEKYEFGPKMTHLDLKKRLLLLQRQSRDAIGAPKIPNVQWSDVGN